MEGIWRWDHDSGRRRDRADRTGRALGLAPKRTLSFFLADGQTPMMLGEPGDEALLGAVTLEILGLVHRRFNRTLQTMRMLLG